MRLLALFAFLFGLTTLHAQSVRWEAGDSAMGSVVQLVFEDCEPDGDPQLPALPNTTLAFAGTSSSFKWINASVSRTMTLSYLVQGRRTGPLQIPAFSVKTNKGMLPVAAFNGAAPTVSADSVATARLIPTKTELWAGEVFGLTYRLTAARRNNPQFDSFVFDWNAAPLLTEEWSKPTANEVVVDGQRQLVIEVQTRAYGRDNGAFKMEAAKQVVHVQTGAVGFGLFSQPRMEPVSVTSNQPTLQVKPLPAPPATFSGAVGEFKLTSKIVPREAAVGEPVTWTLELTGTGNWPDVPGLPAREVSRDFQVVQPRAKRTPAEGKLFEATLAEDVVLVPTKPGQYELGPVTFTFFNPATGRYETVQTEAVTVTVTPGAATAAPAVEAGEKAGATEPAATATPPATPPEPAAIPRDPLPGTDPVARPLSTAMALLLAAAGLLVPIAAWLTLAWRRAFATDPLRPQREAHARLLQLMRALNAQAPRPPDASALLQWQRDSAVLWDTTHAAPEASAVFQPSRDTPDRIAAWTRLWAEAERALYRVPDALPADWVVRAEAELASRPPPRFNPGRLFLPRNLLAFAAGIAVLTLLAGPGTARAATAPDVAYRAGDYTAAEAAWRAAVQANPTDWIARHNLALALAQQDRFGEAAAYASSAFVLNPSDSSVRWHFRLTASKAGHVPGPLESLLTRPDALASTTGPAGWQRLLIGAAWILGAALAWLLVNAFGPRARWQTWAAGALGGAAVALGIVSAHGWRSYGELADERAVIAWQQGTLRSIPTEADTAQQTTTLAAGSVARVNKTFFGWSRLAFANGQTGWVRAEDVVPVWR